MGVSIVLKRFERTRSWRLKNRDIMFIAHIVLLGGGMILGGLVGAGNRQGPSFTLAGILAPFLGPWSMLFEPHACDFGGWDEDFKILAITITATLLASLGYAYGSKPRFLRSIAITLSFVSLILWILWGLADALNSTS